MTCTSPMRPAPAIDTWVWPCRPPLPRSSHTTTSPGIPLLAWQLLFWYAFHFRPMAVMYIELCIYLIFMDTHVCVCVLFSRLHAATSL